MSARAVREHDGKLILSKYISSLEGGLKCARIEVQTKSQEEGLPETIPATLQGSLNTKEAINLSGSDVRKQLENSFSRTESHNPWILSSKLVVKPDQLIKRRGKGGLLLLNCSWEEAKNWILEKAGCEIEVLLTFSEFLIKAALLNHNFRLMEFVVFCEIL